MKNLGAVVPSVDNVIADAADRGSSCSWHGPIIARTKAFVKNIADCPELGVVGMLLSWLPIHYLAETSPGSVT